MPLQPFKATVPQDGKSWWLRLGKENLPDKFIFTLLLDMQPEHFLHRMQDVQILSQFGEYTVYSGVFEGERLGLLYHGSGSFSVSTAIDELAMLGAKAILRVGNSGGMRSDLRVGDIVVCSGGIREDRVTLDYVPWSIRPFRAARWYRPKLKPVNRSALPTRGGPDALRRYHVSRQRL